jgi:ankyrin repeat protein
MPLSVLPLGSPLGDYAAQADTLLAACRAGEPWAIELFHRRHPRFLDERVPWAPKPLSAEEIRATPLDANDARLAVARWYDFADWPALGAHVVALQSPESLVARFEAAVDAVVTGDLEGLEAALARDPNLVHARSSRVTYFDPPVHGATLLHYIAANGVEGYRQKTPANAVEVTRTLLEAGADPDALADLYGGRCTTMSLLVSSTHPARAGLQTALVDTLVDFGASLESLGAGAWTSPLITALVFGYPDAAEALVRRGARIDSLPAAAGLNRSEIFEQLLRDASSDDRHRALGLAAHLGHAAIVRRLLDSGEDPDRYNPAGMHAHATPLHHAALRGHLDVVRALVDRGARTDMRDAIYDATPLGWAQHGGRQEIVKWLASVSEVRGEK